MRPADWSQNGHRRPAIRRYGGVQAESVTCRSCRSAGMRRDGRRPVETTGFGLGDRRSGVQIPASRPQNDVTGQLRTRPLPCATDAISARVAAPTLARMSETRSRSQARCRPYDRVCLIAPVRRLNEDGRGRPGGRKGDAALPAVRSGPSVASGRAADGWPQRRSAPRSARGRARSPAPPARSRAAAAGRSRAAAVSSRPYAEERDLHSPEHVRTHGAQRHADRERELVDLRHVAAGRRHRRRVACRRR
jgi:hypothetical protein